ncbi:MAG: HDOD domain-containing protein [Planctomycetaceae bacterium]|nr:HDOD domain-containing protein [Planctomycetaceae bacterium]
MSVRGHPGRKLVSGNLRSRVEALERLPIRPTTARLLLSAVGEAGLDDGVSVVDWSGIRPISELDPGWVLGEQRAGPGYDPIALVADCSWWSTASVSSGLVDVLQRLWRHTVAVSFATRNLARDAGDAQVDRLVRAGLLHGLGRWAVAAIDGDWIVRWLGQTDPAARRQMEISDLGTELPDLGRRLAERFGCDPLVVEAAWLHDDSSQILSAIATDPARLAIIQEAFRWAESTPWALYTKADAEPMPTEPRLRILIAEVQSRCGSLFAAADATTHEEQASRHAARLTLRLAKALRQSATQERFLRTFADCDPSASPENWAGTAAMAWCAEPEVTTARVTWKNLPAVGGADEPVYPAAEPRDRNQDDERPTRPPSLVLPLDVGSQAEAVVHLWCEESSASLEERIRDTSVLSAWTAWAKLVADRSLRERQLELIVSRVRRQREEAEIRNRAAKLEALAEFAAGAGHELNNPLAVIVGRAQLLLGRTEDAEIARSLHIILGQAQRTHRILRDLMFVARPPAPRLRTCRPSEILRSSLASFQNESEARGVRLSSELEQTDLRTWADPDALAHLAEILIRNAIQATPSGGKVQVRCSRLGNELRWSISDSGKGISPADGAHLFDPFFCGRQAGRGLGLGLPRAARIVQLANGSLQWSSTLGQGTVFQVRLPIVETPDLPVSLERAEPSELACATATPRN